MSNGEIVNDLLESGRLLWESFVRKGYADKLPDGTYIFKKF
jgi:hypothetical protein